MKKLSALILSAALLICCALPSFAAEGESAEGKTPVFDNVREELTIAYGRIGQR